MAESIGINVKASTKEASSAKATVSA